MSRGQVQKLTSQLPTESTQIGNITVEQIATALGSETDHLIEALEEIYPAPSQGDLECQVVEPQ